MRDPAAVAAEVARRAAARRVSLQGVATRARARANALRGDSAAAAQVAKDRAEIRDLESPGFFPTPRGLARTMAELLKLEPGQSVLEPSAGAGHLADALRQAYPWANPVLVERNMRLCDYLRTRRYEPVCEDFLDWRGGPFDAALMNPPFEKNADALHVQHAAELLKPDGRLVAIVCEGLFFRQQRIAADFRQWLADRGGWNVKLPAGIFESSERPTGVQVRLIGINIEEPCQIL